MNKAEVETKQRLEEWWSELTGKPFPVLRESAGSVSSTVVEIRDPELLSKIGEMFSDAEEALRLAVETRLNSESWKSSQKIDWIPKH